MEVGTPLSGSGTMFCAMRQNGIKSEKVGAIPDACLPPALFGGPLQSLGPEGTHWWPQGLSAPKLEAALQRGAV